MNDIRGNVGRIAARVEEAARRAGRDPAGVILIGVTKTVTVDSIRQGLAAGLSHLGENRVQEGAAKIPELSGVAAPGGGPITWHLVGHLQSNKARRAVELFDWIHSVDGAELARRLDRCAAEAGRSPRVLVQVDLGGEPTKHGIDAGALMGLLLEITALPHLKLRGLMTLPPLLPDPESLRPFFRRLRELREELAAGGVNLPDLSMGMSGDFEVAIEEGATMVRVGRALFGERG
jgi:hypothetical protein